MSMNGKQKTRAIIRKIKYQFPESAEGKLFFSVVKLAITDLTDSNRILRASAINYINNDLSHAEACMVSSVWIRELFDRAGCSHLLQV